MTHELGGSSSARCGSVKKGYAISCPKSMLRRKLNLQISVWHCKTLRLTKTKDGTLAAQQTYNLILVQFTSTQLDPVAVAV